MKFAVTIMSPFSGTTTVHVVPVHTPEKPAKVDPALGVAIKVTVEPTGKMARHTPPLTRLAMEHATPPGVLETVPFPVPVPLLIVTAPGIASR
jgi:hypothetical protein